MICRFLLPLQKKLHNMAKYRILIVDDEDDICMILSYSLQQAGYDILVAHSAEEALALFQIPTLSTSISLILLDIMMDGMSGLEMAQQLKQYEQTPPIIFLSALNDKDTVLKGFQRGADDYISKPFHIAEVLARVAAVLRRSSKAQVPPPSAKEQIDTIEYKGIVVQKSDMSLTINGVPTRITRKEIELLCYLLTHRGQVLSREQLLNAVWDKNGYVLERTVDVHITHLRQKLGEYGKHIVTKSGYGYLFEN